MADPPFARLLESESETARFAAALAPALRPGDTLALHGNLGAGKTFLARSLIQARLAAHGLTEDVPSPTYTLVQTYFAGGVELWHADLYRLGDPDEARELGLHDAFDSAICLIEWPDRIAAELPTETLHLHLAAGTRAECRHLDLRWRAGDWSARLASLQATFAAATQAAPAHG